MAANLEPHQMEAVKRLEEFLSYRFSDKSLAWEAMFREGAKGFMKGRTQDQSNRRLAALGDIAIYLIMCQEWYASNNDLRMYENSSMTEADGADLQR
jgi:dsRNA-specific ribonuclease